jgi:hypothetical protein
MRPIFAIGMCRGEGKLHLYTQGSQRPALAPLYGEGPAALNEPASCGLVPRACLSLPCVESRKQAPTPGGPLTHPCKNMTPTHIKTLSWQHATLLIYSLLYSFRKRRKVNSTVPSMSDSAVERAPRDPTEHLQGIVERVTYHAEDSGYTVARLKAPEERDLITILGRFPDIHAGQTLRLIGHWRDHPKYGRQFQVVSAQETKPATLTGLEKYLGSGLIKGIGPVTARRIVAHFGLETLDIIEQSCSRLIEVAGIAQKRVAMIEKAWAAQKAIKEVMIFLQGHGV